MALGKAFFVFSFSLSIQCRVVELSLHRQEEEEQVFREWEGQFRQLAGREEREKKNFQVLSQKRGVDNTREQRKEASRKTKKKGRTIEKKREGGEKWVPPLR